MPSPARIIANMKSPSGRAWIVIMTIPPGIVIACTVYNGIVVNINVTITLGVTYIYDLWRVAVNTHKGNVIK